VHVESGKDDNSSEDHLQSSKTRKGSYLKPKFSIFAKKEAWFGLDGAWIS
jgi:hypothetical protein